ncbi:MAG: serpin family protein [Pseudopedobacter sp.]|nr:serpin family protein [Deinococcales bacterium]
MHKLRYTGTILTLALLLSACSNTSSKRDPTPLEPQTKCELSTVQALPTPTGYGALLEANTQFGLRFFAEVLKDKPNQNLFISPYSAAQAMQMMYQGAGGDTKAKMMAALELGELSNENLNSSNAYLMNWLSGSSNCVTLNIANSVWLDDAFPARPKFVQDNKVGFQAEIRNLDLQGMDAAKTINDWAKQKTSGKIPQLLDPDKKLEEVFFLINATYFKGKWSSPFKPEKTVDAPFTLEGGSTKTVKLMNVALENVGYLETSEFQAVRLPYQSDGQRTFIMELYLPKAGKALSSVLEVQTFENVQSWKWERGTGPLALPRFKLETTLPLKTALEGLGLGVLFTDLANLSGISEVPTLISTALQKTFLEVNEAGSEAAAVTIIGGVPTAAPPPAKLFNLRFDRPFLLKIREYRSSTDLFVGAVYDPESK